MFRYFAKFVEAWEMTPKENQLPLCAAYVCHRREEELVYKAFLRRPIKEIERILDVYVDEVLCRYMWVPAGIYYNDNEGKFLKFFCIHINNEDDFSSQIESFVHEILHILLHQHGLNHPLDERLDEVAVFVAKRYHKKIAKIFLREVKVQSPR